MSEALLPNFRGRQVALQIAYEGSLFHGYQVQPNQRTVESELRLALRRFLGHEPDLICAGRTDAGVHAYSQLVAFFTDSPIPIERYAQALSRMLPDEVQVIQAFEVPADFSARFSAKARHYRYLLAPLCQAPTLRQSAWQTPFEVPFEPLAEAWHSVRGEHNFKAFCKSGSYRNQFVINVRWTHCWQYEQYIVLEILAESFLYNMVRSLVGSAVDVARGRFPLSQIEKALATQDRQYVRFTAPPQGLYLYHVLYPELPQSLIVPGLHDWPVPVGEIPDSCEKIAIL